MSIFAGMAPGQRAGGPPPGMGPAAAPAPQQQQGWPSHVPQPQTFGQPPAPAPQQPSFGGGGGGFGGNGGSIFAQYTPQQMANARPSSNASYEKPGRYIMRIERFKTGRKRQNNEPFVAVEQTVVAVLQADVDGNRVGEVVTDFKRGNNEYFLGEMKATVGGIMGLDDESTDQISLQDLDIVCGPQQPLAGKFVEKNNFLKPVKNPKPNTPGVFTVIQYVREVSPEEVAALVDPQTAQALGLKIPVQQPPALPQQPAEQAPPPPSMFGGQQQGAFAAGAFFGGGQAG